MDKPPDYSAITVNERLGTAGMLDAFGIAARSRDRDRLIRLLKKVAVERPAQTADALGKDPARCRF